MLADAPQKIIIAADGVTGVQFVGIPEVQLLLRVC
jgi:hypothetical protein